MDTLVQHSISNKNGEGKNKKELLFVDITFLLGKLFMPLNFIARFAKCESRDDDRFSSQRKWARCKKSIKIKSNEINLSENEMIFVGVVVVIWYCYRSMSIARSLFELVKFSNKKIKIWKWIFIIVTRLREFLLNIYISLDAFEIKF